MTRRFKHGVYQERARPICPRCHKKWPECKHIAPPKKVVLLAGPADIWMQLNGTNYPAVRFREFNNFEVLEMVLTDTQFRDRYTYLGRFVTHVTKVEKMENW